MAKQPNMNSIFKKTEPEGQPDKKPDDKVKAVGIGLKISEWQRYEDIADELGMTRHALATYALRDFLKRYDKGEIQTETRPRLPGL